MNTEGTNGPWYIRVLERLINEKMLGTALLGVAVLYGVHRFAEHDDERIRTSAKLAASIDELNRQNAIQHDKKYAQTERFIEAVMADADTDREIVKTIQDDAKTDSALDRNLEQIIPLLMEIRDKHRP